MSLRLGTGPRVPKRDRIIQATDLDALSSKHSASLKGYLEDVYVNHLVEEFKAYDRSSEKQFVPKQPLINRGTYLRTRCIDLLVEDFLRSAPGKCQIVSLGAGSCTRPFQLLRRPDLKDRLVYHEIDFATSTRRKAQAIYSRRKVFEPSIGDVGELRPGTGEVHTTNYHLHPLDLRTVGDVTDSQNPLILKDLSFDDECTTLVISECCLCYLEPAESTRVLKWFTTKFSKTAIVIYEPLGGEDQFGKVMVQNLALRGISLPTLHQYHSLDTQVSRLQSLGFIHAFAADIEFMENNWLGSAARDRLNSLEFLDEVEEMNLLFRHYCIAWGSTFANASWSTRPHNSE